MNQTISENIIQLRKEQGLTQMDLASAINYSDKVISKWERGESLPNVEALDALAKHFHVSTDFLLGREKEKLENNMSKKLDVTVKDTPSLFFKLSVFIPLAIWIGMGYFGFEWFLFGSIGFVIYWIIYCSTQLNGTFTATYNGHEIKVVAGVSSIKMYIDDQLVDSNGVPLILTYKLSGKLGTRQVRARVSIFLFSKCEIFID